MDNYLVDVGENNRIETRMKGASENDAVDYVAGLIQDKHQAGYWIVDTRPSFILMINSEYKWFAVRIRNLKAVAA